MISKVKNKVYLIFGILLGFFMPAQGMAGLHMLDGSALSLQWGIPFVGMLASLALLPLMIPSVWHHHFGKITLGWSLLIIIPLFYVYGAKILTHELLVTYGLHYFPFIVLAGSLFIIAGGIRVRIRDHGSPLYNTLTLAIGTVLASFMGTTGAAMLFIRPILHMNEWRHYRRHTMIFFIFLVCNVGGCLTALGDPPLFLGFLFGVDFFWPTFNLWGPFLVLTIPLLIIYFLWDYYLFKKEDHANAPSLADHTHFVKIDGKVNFLLLLGVLGSVLLSGAWKSGIKIPIGTISIELQDLLRDIILILLSLASLKLTDQTPRKANKFTWEPLLEVVKLFAGIFITATPVIAILSAGTKGHLAPLIHLVSDPQGNPLNAAYFWTTGALSAFLDNAPTYMVFFYMAGGDPVALMGTLNKTLIAISAGSVFMGALTYIGNAPNFMVKSISESHQIAMPSFFGFMMWSLLLLAPLFLLVTWIYF